MFLSKCVCVFSGVSFPLFCNNTVVNPFWSHGLCCQRSGWAEISRSGSRDGGRGLLPILILRDSGFGYICGRLWDETLGDSQHEDHYQLSQFWAILEAVLLVSKLKAEITFYAVFVGGGWSQWRLFFLQDGSYRCRWLIVWLVGRICITSPWRIATSSVQQISFDFSGIVHTWSVVTRERLSSLACHRMEDIMHKCNGTFWTFTLWIFILQTVYTGIG